VSRTDDQRVLDILDASDQIAGVVKDGRDTWNGDRLRQLAVERLLEIIGESASSLSEQFRAAHPDVPWSDIIGLRIVLAHHYHRVDPNQVWAIAAGEVPQLAEHLRQKQLPTGVTDQAIRAAPSRLSLGTRSWSVTTARPPCVRASPRALRPRCPASVAVAHVELRVQFLGLIAVPELGLAGYLLTDASPGQARAKIYGADVPIPRCVPVSGRRPVPRPESCGVVIGCLQGRRGRERRGATTVRRYAGRCPTRRRQAQ
jgi:uncharacterized protein with HEPN domain